MSDKILVTGATGQIGSLLVERLAGAGVPARALVRSREKAARIEQLGLEPFVGDFDAPETLRPALDGVEKVFLLSAPDQRQVELQGNLIEAARGAGVRHIVKLSAIGTGPDSPFSLGRWHYQTEQEIERSGMRYTHLRPNGFMQNALMFAPTIRGQGAFYGSLGETKVSYVDARDVAAVALATLTEDGHEGKAYEVTGPESLSYREIAGALSSVLGKEVRYVDVPMEAARQGMMGAGMPEWLADALVELFEFYRMGGAAHVTETVREVAGSEPISVSRFAADYAGAFK
ncbi:MAG TPA: SDR family oxidoreductase [Pyrinomonadaceae bacterium]